MRIISEYYFLRCLVLILIFSNVSTVRTSREEAGCNCYMFIVMDIKTNTICHVCICIFVYEEV